MFLMYIRFSDVSEIPNYRNTNAKQFQIGVYSNHQNNDYNELINEIIILCTIYLQ